MAKLVTFGDGEGRVGVLDGEEIAVLDVPTMRGYFERGGADETGERVAARRDAPPGADRPEEVLPHGRELPRARRGVEERQLVARDRAVDQLLPERRRDRRARRARDLPRAPDGGARLRAGARRRPREAGQVVHAGGGDGLRRRVRDLQRHHGARHPARRDALGRLQLLQGDRHVLPARAVDRDAGRGARPARPRDAASSQRRGAAGVALRPHVRDDPRDPLELLRPHVLGGRRPLDGHGVRRRGLQVAGGAGTPLPEARRRDRGRDRAHRRPPQPRDLVAGGARRAAAAPDPAVGRA